MSGCENNERYKVDIEIWIKRTSETSDMSAATAFTDCELLSLEVSISSLA